MYYYFVVGFFVSKTYSFSLFLFVFRGRKINILFSTLQHVKEMGSCCSLNRLLVDSSTLFEILMTYVQYVSILVNIRVPWPDDWMIPLEWTKLFSLDIDLSFLKLPSLDYRTYYLLVVVIVPLALSFIMLLFFKPVSVIVWYFLLCLSLACLVAGTFGSVVPSLSLGVGQVMSAWGFLIAGGIGLAVCLAFLIKYAIQHRNEMHQFVKKYKRKKKEKIEKIHEAHANVKRIEVHPAEDNEPVPVQNVTPEGSSSLMEIELEEPASLVAQPKRIAVSDVTESEIDPSALRAWQDAEKMKKKQGVEPKTIVYKISMIASIFGVLVLGILACGIIDLSSLSFLSFLQLDSLTSIIELGKFLGYACFVVAAILTVYLILVWFEKGRKFLQKAKSFADNQFIKVLLLALICLYIPVTSALFTSWSCQSISCPVGYEVPLKSSGLSVASFFNTKTTNSTDYCVTCSFYDDTCPWKEPCSCAEELCSGDSVKRLAEDPGISCSEVASFFAPISGIMCLGVVIGLPAIFFLLIRYHANFLQKLRVIGENLENRWQQRVYTTDNSAKVLYVAFEYKWRYYKVLLLIQKLLVVIASIFLFLKPFYLALILIVINGSFFILSLFWQPYNSKIMDLIQNATSFSLMLGSVLAAILAWGIAVPDAVSLTLSCVVFTLPVIGAIIGTILQFRAERKVASAMKEEEEKCKANAEMAEPLQQTQEQGIELEDLDSPHNETNLSNDGRHLQVPSADHSKKLDIDPEPIRKTVSKRTLFAMDYQLNMATLKYLSSYFVFVGALAFICLAIGLIGILYASANSPVFKPTTSTEDKTDATQLQFIGYGSWENFTMNCCCRAGDPVNDFTTVESWYCRNGLYKERGREKTTSNSSLSGLPLREFCSRDFSTEVCGLSFDPSGKYKVETCTGAPAYSDDILFYLW